MRTSSEQEFLLKKLESVGFLTLEDFHIYSTPSIRKANLERFIILGLIKPDPNVSGKWIKNKL